MSKATLVFFLLFGFKGQNAFSQDCTSLVVDQAEMLGRDISGIHAELSKLHMQGAKAYVRTFRSFGNAGSVANFSRQLAGQCEEWNKGPGLYADNLILLVITEKERKLNIALGSNYNSSVRPRSGAIQAQSITPHFKAKRFSDGVVVGLREIHAYVAPRPVQATPPPRRQAAAGVKTPEAVKKSEVDPVKVVKFLAVLLCCVAVFGLVFEVRNLYTARSQAKIAKKILLGTMDMASDLVLRLPEIIKSLDERLELLATYGLDVKSVKADLGGASEKLGALMARYKTLTDGHGGVREGKLLAVEAYRSAHENFAYLVEDLAGIEQALRGLDAGVSANEDRINSLEEETQEAANEIDLLKVRIAQMRDMVLGFAKVYARKSWDSVRGNGSAAEACVKNCEDKLPLLRLALSQQSGSKKQALALLGEIQAEINKANSLLDSIVVLNSDLLKARQKAGKLVVSVGAELSASESFEQTHDADISDLVKPKLQEARRFLQMAQAELENTAPDYFEAINLANRARSIGQEVLEQSQREQLAAESQRKELVELAAAAETRLRKAQHYFADRPAHVTTAARMDLWQAEQYLIDAKQARDPRDRKRLYQAADLVAKQAYQLVEGVYREALGMNRSGARVTAAGFSESKRRVSTGSSSGDIHAVVHGVPDSNREDEDSRRFLDAGSDSPASYEAPSEPDGGSDDSSDW